MFKPVKWMEAICKYGHNQVALVGMQLEEPVLLFQVNLIFLLFIILFSRTSYSCSSFPIVPSINGTSSAG